MQKRNSVPLVFCIDALCKVVECVFICLLFNTTVLLVSGIDKRCPKILMCVLFTGEQREISLADSKCESERRGWHGPPLQDHWRCHHRQSEEKIHGWFHICILLWVTHVTVFQSAHSFWVHFWVQNRKMIENAVVRLLSLNQESSDIHRSCADICQPF